MSVRVFLVVGALFVAMSSSAIAQQLYVYPTRGQSPEQQQQDRYQCSAWATEQTGFNPAVPPPVPQVTSPPPPGIFGGALGGSALGAIGGAIGGNAGKGAAIGALVGGLFGGIRRNRWAQEQEYNADQQTSAYYNARAAYQRAETACLTGRGYSVT